MVQQLGWMPSAHWEVCGLLNVLDIATHMTAGQCTHCSPPCIALGETQPLGGPLARSGMSACALQWAGCLWTWQRWWWWRKWWQAWAAVAVSQTGGHRAWGFKPSVKQKKREKGQVGSPDDCWQVLFDHLQTGMGAGQGLVHMVLGVGQGLAHMGAGKGLVHLPLAHWEVCGLLNVLVLATLHDSRPVYSPFASLHRFGAESASGW